MWVSLGDADALSAAAGLIRAWDAPWSCGRDDPPRVFALADECRACPHFVRRGDAGIEWTIAQIGL